METKRILDREGRRKGIIKLIGCGLCIISVFCVTSVRGYNEFRILPETMATIYTIEEPMETETKEFHIRLLKPTPIDITIEKLIKNSQKLTRTDTSCIQVCVYNPLGLSIRFSRIKLQVKRELGEYKDPGILPETMENLYCIEDLMGEDAKEIHILLPKPFNVEMRVKKLQEVPPEVDIPYTVQEFKRENREIVRICLYESRLDITFSKHQGK